MIKLIEFAMKNDQTYLIGLFDCNDISSIEQNKNDKKSCLLNLKNGRQHIIPGLYRNLTNRHIYCLEKKVDLYQDYLIRPSISFFHDVKNIEIDSVFFDKEQLLAFSKALEIPLNLPKNIKSTNK